MRKTEPTEKQRNDRAVRAAWQLRTAFRHIDAWDLRYGHLAIVPEQIPSDALRERLGIATLAAEAVADLSAFGAES